MNEIFILKINWVRNIPFVLDAILEIGIGTLLLANSHSTIQIIGFASLIFGIVQLIRKIKTFHLTNSYLTIKRPLFPFKFTHVEFDVKQIELIEFKRVIRIGPYIKILGKVNGKNGGFMICTDTQSIDIFENKLKSIGLQVSRENV